MKHKDLDISLESIFAILPAKNEGTRIEPVLVSLQMQGIKNIIVVNDGSDDNTKDVVNKYRGIIVLDHIINLGPGAATLTGVKYAMKNGAKYVVTLDADSQHNPENIMSLVEHLEENELDLVIGSRFLQYNDIPFIRLIYNFFGNFISFLITGVYLSDSQSGMKAMSQKFAKQLDISFDGFEFCIEIIKQAKIHNAKVGEIPIDVRYTADTMSKGQNFQTGLGMLLKLFNPFS